MACVWEKKLWHTSRHGASSAEVQHLINLDFLADCDSQTEKISGSKVSQQAQAGLVSDLVNQGDTTGVVPISKMTQS